MPVETADHATPIYLFSGFLGSGKTTLINSLIKSSKGVKFGVIVNEFGEMSIDGALIREAGGKDIVELPNGCFCCASKGDLGGALQTLVEIGGDFDYLLVESSGLANPGPVVETISRSVLRDRLYVKDVVTVVDAKNFDRNLDTAEAAFYQIAYADLFIINKVGSVSPQDVSAISAGLEKINENAPQIINRDATLSLDELKSHVDERGNSHARQLIAPHIGHHNHYETHTLEAHGVFSESQLTNWLENLPETVVRAKGIVRITVGGVIRVVAIHLVAGNASIEPLESSLHGDLGLVVIGTELNKPRFQEQLNACRVPTRVGL